MQPKLVPFGLVVCQPSSPFYRVLNRPSFVGPIHLNSYTYMPLNHGSLRIRRISWDTTQLIGETGRYLSVVRVTYLPSKSDSQATNAAPKYMDTNGLVRSSTDSSL